LPTGVYELIRARLRRLSPAASQFLSAGAILGSDFAFEQLYRVADLRESEGLAALDEVLANRLFLETGGELRDGTESRLGHGGSYCFAHDKIRDVVYREIGKARRRIFHQRALEVLQAADIQRAYPYTVPPAELAHHALAAGLYEQAFRHSLAAGDNALQLFAVRNAIAH
jgi:predicted ATPase